MKKCFTFFLLFACITLTAQTTTDFEDLNLPLDTFLNGSDLSGGYSSGAVFLPNNYNLQFDSWVGWSVSTTTDTVETDFSNQYSAITGGGAEGSDTYAVSYNFVPNILHLQPEARGSIVEGMYVTNTTVTYLIMRDGNSFAKIFGGETGDDPDFYSLTIKAYSNGQLSADSVEFFLADYRFADNSEDYLVDEWTWVELSELGPADSLYFDLRSSDVGMFGINTPTYFCLDHLITSKGPLSASSPLPDTWLQTFPNPAAERLWIEWKEQTSARAGLYSLSGQLVLSERIEYGLNSMKVELLPGGVYLLRVIDQSGGWVSRKVMVGR